jgi:DNA-binding transcriptional LysR family regulator
MAWNFYTVNTPLPIKSLLVFDAVMKHHSLTLAAAELHVTPDAVGQQIQKLEEWLGAPLCSPHWRAFSRPATSCG